MTSVRCFNFCCFMMASYFGEIIEPGNRAIFNDSSDDEDTSGEPQLHLSWSNADYKLPSVLDVFLLCHGRLTLAFTEAYILDRNLSPVLEIRVAENDSNVDRDEDHHYKHLPSRIYIENNVAFCLVSPSCSPELGYHFTEAISPFLKISKKVIVFTNESLHNYKVLSLNDLPPAFMRELKTKYNTSKDAAEKLPTPNFITGIPAGVISWCQIFKKDGSAFVCYSDQQKLDSITALPYIKVLKNLGYQLIKDEKPDFNRKSFYGKPEVVGGSTNIYL